MEKEKAAAKIEKLMYENPSFAKLFKHGRKHIMCAHFIVPKIARRRIKPCHQCTFCIFQYEMCKACKLLSLKNPNRPQTDYCSRCQRLWEDWNLRANDALYKE